MNQWQWRGIISVVFALSLVVGWAAGTAVAQKTGGEICTDGLDNDGNKLIDCADPACATDPVCKGTPVGTPCSPGYWKNHPNDFNAYCGAAVALSTTDRFGTCDALYTALTCTGRDSTCGRSAAADLLNDVSGCVE